MSRNGVIIVAVLALVASVLACSVPQIPEIHIKIPQLEIGELREDQISVPMPEASSVEVDVRFGAGSLTLTPNPGSELLAARFAYNVESWKPEVVYEDGKLTVRQGGDDGAWGVPAGDIAVVKNEWELALSPNIPLDLRVMTGAGKGTLDLTGLQLTELELDVGAGDLTVRFGEPNPVRMRRLSINAGASQLEVNGIGNASPETVQVKGGAGDLDIGLGGSWADTASVEILAGVGSIKLRVPRDLGVRIEMKGAATTMEAPGFSQEGNTYVNEAYGEAATELRIELTMGVGDVEVEMH